MLSDTIQAVENPTEKYQVQSIKMEEIFSDAAFNCRGSIAPVDVVDLSKDIAVRGLDQPIVLRPYSDPERPWFKYKIVAGHRRHMAFRVNNATEIPAYVREDLDELAARMLNLRENLHRKQLNIKQEAHALKFFLQYKGTGQNTIFNEVELADIFAQSRGWVQVRKALLELPDDIQDEAAAGMLTQDHIKTLARMKSTEDRYKLVREIKTRKLKGEKVKLTQSVTRASDVLKAKARDHSEVLEMNGLIYDVIGPSLTTRFGAWMAGEISTAALMATLEDHCKNNEIPFKMPKFVTNAVLGIDTPGSDAPRFA